MCKHNKNLDYHHVGNKSPDIFLQNGSKFWYLGILTKLLGSIFIKLHA